jgi:hypothetical protein
MTTSRKLLITGLLAAVLGATESAVAAALAPAKPSQVVTLTNGSGNDCPFLGEAVDTQLFPDGSVQPFTIPAKQVLVITEVDWGVVFGPASAAAVVALSVQPPSATQSIPFFLDVTPADATGTAGGTAAIANAIVRSGSTVCVAGGTTGTKQVILRGFLTKDR